MEPPELNRVTRTLKRIAPLKAGTMLAIVYGIMGLVFIPFFLLMTVVSSQLPQSQRVGMMALGAGFAICFPLIYAAAGFIGGILGALVYNLAAKWVGGIEFDVE
jgi:hypothetical protein